jgi:hypothetical protein
MNLEPLPLYYSNSDLEAMLSTDKENSQYIIGENCKEFLEQFTGKALYLRNNYEERMQAIIDLRNLERRQEKEQKQQLYQIEMQFQKLKNVPKKIINTHSGIEVNPSYTSWLDTLKEFHAKLNNKNKGFEQSGRKAPEKFTEILNNINELLEKHSK